MHKWWKWSHNNKNAFNDFQQWNKAGKKKKLWVHQKAENQLKVHQLYPTIKNIRLLVNYSYQ